MAVHALGYQPPPIAGNDYNPVGDPNSLFGRNSGGVIGAVFAVFQTIGSPFLLDAGQGAETSIYLASSPEVETTTGEYFVKSKSVSSNDESYDPEIARRLWDVSEELVKQAT